MKREDKLLTEYLYVSNARPAKELSKHDQKMIGLGWNAAKELFYAQALKGVEELIDFAVDSLKYCDK